MVKALDGLTILVPESRELDLFVAMLEAKGASAVRCPLVRILDLYDTTDAEAWMRQAADDAFEDVIWLTGEGLRRLLAIGDRTGQRASFVAALARMRMITRGPKPAKVLRELGLAPGLAASTPTSDGVLEALAPENLDGRRIGLQLYPGDGGLPLVAALRARGATVSTVTPYRYASQAEAAKILDAIAGIASGDIGMVAFTSSPQVDRLFEVAREAGLEDLLRAGLGRVSIAAMGPVVEKTLTGYGLASEVSPETSFHLKPLVTAIAANWTAKGRP